jgi:hypothetical protein
VTVEADAYEGRLDPALAALVPASLRVVRAPAWGARASRRAGFGDLGLRAFTGLRRVCDDLLRREAFDALFITIYPAYPAMLGPWLKRRHRVPLVLDYQDPWVGAWGREVGGGPGGAPDLRSRISRAVAARLEPRALEAADALTAVSARTYEDALARSPHARPRVLAEIPLGADASDLDALGPSRPTIGFDPDDGCLHVSYVGTLLPKGITVARAVLAALARLRALDPSGAARLRVHFVGTSNTRDPDAPARVLPLAHDMGVAGMVSEIPQRIDYLDALHTQLRSHVVLLMGSSEPHYTPSKVFPALLTRRPLVAVYERRSPVIDLLKPFARAHVVAFDGDAALDGQADAIAAAFRAALAHGVVPAGEPTLGDWAAPALARRLARVLDQVAGVCP